MSDNLYLASGFAVFVLCVAVHWVLYANMAPRLQAADPVRRREALLRWFWLIAVWELAVLAVTALYVILARGAHDGIGAWTAPVFAAVAGNMLPLQVAVIGISKAAR